MPQIDACAALTQQTGSVRVHSPIRQNEIASYLNLNPALLLLKIMFRAMDLLMIYNWQFDIVQGKFQLNIARAVSIMVVSLTMYYVK